MKKIMISVILLITGIALLIAGLELFSSYKPSVVINHCSSDSLSVVFDLKNVGFTPGALKTIGGMGTCVRALLPGVKENYLIESRY